MKLRDLQGIQASAKVIFILLYYTRHISAINDMISICYIRTLYVNAPKIWILTRFITYTYDISFYKLHQNFPQAVHKKEALQHINESSFRQHTMNKMPKLMKKRATAIHSQLLIRTDKNQSFTLLAKKDCFDDPIFSYPAHLNLLHQTT